MRTLIFVTPMLSLLLAACGGGQAPLTADAGADITVAVGEAPTFDGCGSTGEITNYRWTVLSAPDAKAEDVGKMLREVDANCSFTLEANMGIAEVGEWVIELTVSDAAGNAATDTVTVTVGQ